MYCYNKRIENFLNCKKCERSLDEPRILQCGETICSLCSSSIFVDSNYQYDCLVCSKKHDMNKQGLPLIKSILEMLSLEPCEYSRGDAAEKMNESLKIVKTKIEKLALTMENGVDRVKDFCKNLKEEVKLASENTIQQINYLREKMIAEIESYQNECIQAHCKEKIKEFKTETVEEMKLFHTKWSDYLKQIKIADQPLLEANKLAIEIIKKAEIEQELLDDLIFKGTKLQFISNKNKSPEDILGYLTKLSRFDSCILQLDQPKELLDLCQFTEIQKWNLIYRATRDGFGASQFHAKCDKKPNTLIIIKSTNGNVFGGYTEQDWTHSGYKSDLKEFFLT